VLAVSTSYSERHPDVVEKVVESILEGLAFGLAPRNQQLVTDMLAMKMKLVNVETAAAAYRSFLAVPASTAHSHDRRRLVASSESRPDYLQ